MKAYKLNKLFQFLFLFLFFFGGVLIALGLNDVEVTKLKYEENNNIKYNVYLKENNFFETPYLGEDKTYIASLIDYIDVNFNYNVKYNMNLTGDYRYKYVAIVRANKRESDGYYWEKEYDLSEEKTVHIKEKNQISIGDNFKIKYSTYNDILSEFKKTYGVDTNGELKIVMKVANLSKANNIDEPIVINSELSLSIPLLEQALEVSIDKNTTNNKNVISLKEKSSNKIYIAYKVVGALFIIMSIFGFIKVTKANRKLKKQNNYKITLDKILNSYDSIIANVDSLPSFSSFEKIKIHSFSELLDVYNELRMPINYYQNQSETESVFFIINDDIVWIYKLRKKELK